MQKEHLYIYWHLDTSKSSALLCIYPPDNFDAEINWLKSVFPHLEIAEEPVTFQRLVKHNIGRCFKLVDQNDIQIGKALLQKLADFGWQKQGELHSGTKQEMQEGAAFRRLSA